MQLFTLIFSLFCLLTTALPFIKSARWWIRIFDYPRIQIAVFTLLAAALTLYFLTIESAPALLLFGCLCVAFVYQLSLIVKYTVFYPVQARMSRQEDPDNTIRIMESNVRMKNRKSHLLIKLVEEYSPDIVIVNEPDHWWETQLGVMNDTYPYSIKKPLENTYGMILYSKFPFKNKEINYQVSEDIPSFYVTLLLPSSSEVDVHCLHPKPPMPGSPTYERDTEILLIGKKVKSNDRPAIVVGDLNDVAWSYTSQLFQRYSGLLDPRLGRGLFNTYNVFLPFFRYPLDHFFYSSHFGLLRLKRLRSIGSDHFPMLLEIVYEKGISHAQDKPQADQEDKQEVEEKIAEGQSL